MSWPEAAAIAVVALAFLAYFGLMSGTIEDIIRAWREK